MKITFYGQSCLGIEINGTHILVDPFITANPKASHIDLDSIKADYLLLTHAHFDHVNDVSHFAKEATIIANHEMVQYYEKNGGKGHGMNHGGSWQFPFGKVKMVNAIHSSSFPDGTYGGNPCGFVIDTDEKSIYISGDTALTMDMKLIPMFFELDLAILPVGGNFTMDIEEALLASDFVECNKVLGVHYDTFPPIEIDHEASQKKFAEKGKELILLNIGESLTL